MLHSTVSNKLLYTSHTFCSHTTKQNSPGTMSRDSLPKAEGSVWWKVAKGVGVGLGLGVAAGAVVGVTIVSGGTFLLTSGVASTALSTATAATATAAGTAGAAGAAGATTVTLASLGAGCSAAASVAAVGAGAGAGFGAVGGVIGGTACALDAREGESVLGAAAAGGLGGGAAGAALVGVPLLLAGAAGKGPVGDACRGAVKDAVKTMRERQQNDDGPGGGGGAGGGAGAISAADRIKAAADRRLTRGTSNKVAKPPRQGKHREVVHNQGAFGNCHMWPAVDLIQHAQARNKGMTVTKSAVVIDQVAGGTWDPEVIKRDKAAINTVSQLQHAVDTTPKASPYRATLLAKLAKAKALVPKKGPLTGGWIDDDVKRAAMPGIKMAVYQPGAKMISHALSAGRPLGIHLRTRKWSLFGGMDSKDPGTHAMLVTEVFKRNGDIVFRIKNSWGSKRGKHGFVTRTWKELQKHCKIIDMVDVFTDADVAAGGQGLVDKAVAHTRRMQAIVEHSEYSQEETSVSDEWRY